MSPLPSNRLVMLCRLRMRQHGGETQPVPSTVSRGSSVACSAPMSASKLPIRPQILRSHAILCNIRSIFYSVMTRWKRG